LKTLGKAGDLALFDGEVVLHNLPELALVEGR